MMMAVVERGALAAAGALATAANGIRWTISNERRLSTCLLRQTGQQIVMLWGSAE
jgi:hypothetical protein